MALEQDLMKLEEGFWTGGEDYYRDHLDDECLVAFADMAGVQGRDAIAKMAEERRWRDVSIEEKGFVNPTPDTAILSTETTATRADGQPYHAITSTVYVKRDGEWKMAFHGQTELKH